MSPQPADEPVEWRLPPKWQAIPTVGAIVNATRERGPLAHILVKRHVDTEHGLVTHYLGERLSEGGKYPWVRACDAKQFKTEDDAATAALVAERYTPQEISFERVYRSQLKDAEVSL